MIFGLVKKSAVGEHAKRYTGIGLRSGAEGGPVKDRRRQSTQLHRVASVLVVVNENGAKHEGFHLVHRYTIS